MIWWGIVGIIVDNIVDGARFDNVDNVLLAWCYYSIGFWLSQYVFIVLR